ncbi:zinc-dependent alcohol dehydrogenase [Pseudonocardia halophobica]|uniref:zinc-dependent alcohol dehydrogenase n=1 Tax=Pseudonocardia halophobica TaxID=29401 RepID=UPI003D91CD97
MPGPCEVLLRVAFAGICGTDLHAYHSEGDYRGLPTPLVLGHEFSGVVIATGEGVSSGRAGERVLARVIQSCGTCRGCAAGLVNLCPDREVPGITYDGGFAEFVTLPAHHTVSVPGELGLDLAALIEPVSVAVHAVERAESGRRLPRGRAVVSGPGAIGLFSALLLRDRGYDVVVVGTEQDVDTRLAAAAAAGLATGIVGPAGYTGPPTAGAGLWLEASGSAAALGTALDSLAAGGVLCSVGLGDRPLGKDLASATRRELSVLFSMASGPEDYRAAAALLSDRPADVRRLVHDYAFLDCERALADARSGRTVKPLLTIGGEP